MAHNPFRFGFQSFNTASPQAWRETLAKVEDHGYSTFFLADHLLGAGPAIESAAHPPQMLAAVPAMAMALALTRRINVGCRVFCMDYQLPVVLAKQVATMQYLAGGRVEMGLGAGWVQAEYEAIGRQFDPFGVRLQRFAAVVDAVKQFMTGEQLDIANDWIHWQGFAGAPVPEQRPPLMIGGGSKGILTLAGREADIVSLNYNNSKGVIGIDGVKSGFADQTRKKIGWIRDGAGARFDSLELEVGAYLTVVTDQQAATAGAIAGQFGVTVEELLSSPHNLVGSVDYICEELQRRREEWGISYVTVLDDGAGLVDAFAPVVARLAGK